MHRNNYVGAFFETSDQTTRFSGHELLYQVKLFYHTLTQKRLTQYLANYQCVNSASGLHVKTVVTVVFSDHDIL